MTPAQEALRDQIIAVARKLAAADEAWDVARRRQDYAAEDRAQAASSRLTESIVYLVRALDREAP